MTTSPSPTDDSPAPQSGAFGRMACVAEVLAVLAIFVAQGAWPVPDVNEAHYLGKARSFWDPSWIEDDFFLDSADSHLVFYVAVGPLARLPLETFAWVGRLMTWLLLAAAWTRLNRTVLGRAWLAPFSAALFLLLHHWGEMAGEWIVGGFEAKGLSYAMVFMALDAVATGRWNRAWLWLGGATAMHVLVGGWSAVALGLAWLFLGKQRPPLPTMVWGLAGAALLALPGLWTALALTWGIDGETVRDANRIYVFGRLRHHLDPRWFLSADVVWFAVLVVVWFRLPRLEPRALLDVRLRAVMQGVLTIAAVGFAIAYGLARWPDLQAALLRYYWFRLSDVLLPAGVALALTASIVAWLDRRHRFAKPALLVALVVSLSYVGNQAWEKWTAPAPRSYRVHAASPATVRRARFEDWRAACHWAKQNTPPSARFITPRLQQTFKWYAVRSEVVNWKDVPQDAVSLVEWWRRLADVHRDPDQPGRWHRSLTELNPARLRALGERYGASYALMSVEPRIALSAVYQNNSYAIYRLDLPGDRFSEVDAPSSEP